MPRAIEPKSIPQIDRTAPRRAPGPAEPWSAQDRENAAAYLKRIRRS